MFQSRVVYLKKPKGKSKKGKKQRRVRNIDGIKYFTPTQIKTLRRTVRDRAELDRQKEKVTAVREWMAIDFLTSSGVRVSEAANLRCGDLRLGYGQFEVFIREGKGSKSRTIQIPKSLKRHFVSFLKWKESIGEPTDDDSRVFWGQRGPWTSQAIQLIVKKYLKLIGLYEPGRSAHALRHSYAFNLYRQEKDIIAVKKQLGHANIESSKIYADITKEDIQEQIKGFWN